MHGNVWEWCWDVFDEAYYKHSPESDPAGPAEGSLRVNRGGSYFFGGLYCRSATRSWWHTDPPGSRNNTGQMGFRVARSAGE
jgi:formylglycine-generating enzyme required for sulfatase activity